MTNALVAEILRATGTLRSGDPAGATAIIEAALAAGGLRPEPGRAVGGPPPRLPGRSGRRLDEVVRTLAAGRRRLGLDEALPGVQAPAPEPPLPAGAEFRDLHFACAAGGRRYRLYVPASSADGLRGLVVMLHGCTQSPEDFAAGTGMNRLAEAHRLLVAYPAQTGSENPMSCWNWFRPQDQLRGAGEPALIAGLAESVRDGFAIPPDRVFVAGLSAGGAMAAVLAETYPDVFAAAGIHSGLARGSASDVATAFGAMRGQAPVDPSPARAGGGSAGARLIVFHGAADGTVHPSNAHRIVAGRLPGADRTRRSDHAGDAESRPHSRWVVDGADGAPELELWMVEGGGHAWFGGDPSGSYTDPSGPSASEEMVRFFLSGAFGEAG
jgi:poly(hydroxyalkanoate) depolymerase family esterase